MKRQLSEQRKSLIEATKRYHASFAGSAAEQFLGNRGLAAERVTKYRFGYVEDPLPGHERYRGKLVIPYLRRNEKDDWTVVSIRFRCARDGCHHEGHNKYDTMTGDTPRLYNTTEIVGNHNRIAITEGELDAVCATLSGVPAIGVTGAQTWKRHYKEAFIGYERVHVLADGDDAGTGMAEAIAKDLPNVSIHKMPPGEDVNSFVMANGADALRERIGWDE